MRVGIVVTVAGALTLGGCTTSAMQGFPTPGSYNPMAVTRPVDPGAVAVGRELNKVERSIENGRDSGQLSGHEAKGLRKANRALASTADLLGSDGLTAGEQRDLENQARILDSQVQAAIVTGDPPKAPR